MRTVSHIALDLKSEHYQAWKESNKQLQRLRKSRGFPSKTSRRTTGHALLPPLQGPLPGSPPAGCRGLLDQGTVQQGSRASSSHCLRAVSFTNSSIRCLTNTIFPTFLAFPTFPTFPAFPTFLAFLGFQPPPPLQGPPPFLSPPSYKVFVWLPGVWISLLLDQPGVHQRWIGVGRGVSPGGVPTSS